MISGVLKANELNEVGAVLESDHALAMIERDVYWPKWDSPWWYILLLDETGLIEQVPVDVFKELLTCADRQYLKFFPTTEDELDGDVNGYTEIMCFCFLGSLMKVASKLDFDVFAHVPWAKEWITRYQLSDGGYNCDEAAYTGSRKSSILSTTVMLEGMIEYAQYSQEVDVFVPNMVKAVSYLLKHQLFLSSSGEAIKGTDWDKLIFPRFYEYDFARGLEAIFDFLRLTGKKVRHSSIAKALDLIDAKVAAGLNHSEKQWLADEKTISYYIEKPAMFNDLANLPLLMKKLNSAAANEFVPAILSRVKEKYLEVKERGLIVE